MCYMSLSRALRNLYITPTHVPPLTTGPMHREFIHITTHNTYIAYIKYITYIKYIPYIKYITIYTIHHNTQNTSQYIKYITIHKIHHNTQNTSYSHSQYVQEQSQWCKQKTHPKKTSHINKLSWINNDVKQVIGRRQRAYKTKRKDQQWRNCCRIHWS